MIDQNKSIFIYDRLIVHSFVCECDMRFKHKWKQKKRFYTLSLDQGFPNDLIDIDHKIDQGRGQHNIVKIRANCGIFVCQCSWINWMIVNGSLMTLQVPYWMHNKRIDNSTRHNSDRIDHRLIDQTSKQTNKHNQNILKMYISIYARATSSTINGNGLTLPLINC